MNETATRPRPVARERHRHARDGQRRDRRAARPAGRIPQDEVADVKVLAVHRRAGLAHLRGQDQRARTRGVRAHRESRAEVADQRRDDVAAPRAVRAAVGRRRAAGGSRRRRSPPGRASGIPSPGTARSAVAHLAAREERLQAVVGRAGQDHAAQDLEPLVAGQRRRDRLAAQEPVARLEQLFARLIETLRDRDAGRGVGQGFRQSDGQLLAQALGERGADRRDGCGVASRVLPAGRGESRGRRSQGEGERLGDEGREAPGEISPDGDGREGLHRSFHGARDVSPEPDGGRCTGAM